MEYEQMKNLIGLLTLAICLGLLLIRFLLKTLTCRKFELSIWKGIQELMPVRLTLEDKFKRVINLLWKIVKTKWANIYLLDKDGKTLIRRISEGFESEDEERGTKLPLEPGVDMDRSFEPLHTIQIEDSHKGLNIVSQGRVRLLSLPLKGNDEKIKGIIQLGPIFPKHLSLLKKRRKFLSSLSIPLFLTIEDSIVIDGLREKVTDYQLFGDINIIMMRSLTDIESFLKLNLGVALTGTEADGGFIIIKERNLWVSQNVTDEFIKGIEKENFMRITSSLIMAGEKITNIPSAKNEGIKSLLVSPICSDGDICGIVGLINRKDTPFTSNNLRLVEIFAQRIGLSFRYIQSFHEISADYLITLRNLVAAMDIREPWTIGHSKRIAKFSVWIAEELGLPESEIKSIEEAAYLHDIGMCGIAEQILSKPGKFTDYEYSVVKHHSQIGACLVAPIKAPLDLSSAVKHHHERYDGLGYPDGLKGEEIPLSARILTVADVFNARISSRSYRKSLPFNEALKTLKETGSRQFDPRVVEAFLSAVKKRCELVSKDKPLEPCYKFKECPDDICSNCPAYKSDKNCWEVKGIICSQHGDTDCQYCGVYTEWKARQ